MSPATLTHLVASEEANADWRWRAVRLAHEVERTLEIKRARGGEIDPLDERLEGLSREIVGQVG